MMREIQIEDLDDVEVKIYHSNGKVFLQSFKVVSKIIIRKSGNIYKKEEIKNGFKS